MTSAADALGKVADGARGSVGAADILGAGQRVIAGMRSTTGSCRPDAGEAFALGADGFLGAAQAIDAAFPREWDGAAAQSYSEATRRLATATEALAVLDRDVHTVIDREATQIIRRREAFDDQSDQLSSLRRVTGSLAGIPGVGPAMTSSIELAAVTAAVSVCETELTDLATETADNASRLQRLAGDYEALIDAAAPADDEAVPTEGVPTGALPAEEPHADDGDPEPPAAAAAPPASTCPAPNTTSAPDQSPMSADLMSGLTSAFGAVGGMIGAAVAPLAAVLSGVVTAAGQLPSLASQAATPQAVQVDTADDEDDPERGSELPPAEADTEPVDPAGAAPPEAQQPPEQSPSPPPAPPAPAATRPPQ